MDASEVERPVSLAIEKCARALDMPLSTAYSLVKLGVLKSYRVGRRVYVPASELVDFPARQMDAQCREGGE